MPPTGNQYRPNPPAYHPPAQYPPAYNTPPPGWRVPTIPPNAIPPMQLWQNVFYECVQRALQDHGCKHTSNRPVELSTADAEALLSPFHNTLKASIQKELSGFRTMLNENIKCVDPAALSSGIKPEDIKIIRQEIQSLRDTVCLEFKALAQGERKLMDVTASWSTTAKTLVQALQETVGDLKNILTQDQKKYWSGIEALRAEQLSAFKRGPTLDTLSDLSQTAKEIKIYLQEIQGLLHHIQGKKLSQKDLKPTPLRGGPVTRAQARREQKGRRRGSSKTY
ncbi:hypothetical protein FANTH_10098 [Fusarium anthophilum]|uniref:Uncharacterized protein n=1 Tax=Fusarium anthophilum TaxID=48485 RepID=A0A8H5DX55_9HYPO|nr:hypothetical protein FANTH_10098 [Fusarium anthophilum]